MKYKRIEVKFQDIPNMIDSLQGISGIYIFHTARHIWYVGKAVDLQNRFVTSYLKKEGVSAHVNEGLRIRIHENCPMSVVFILMSIEEIEFKEIEVIRKGCPWFNDVNNPRNSINAIQVMVGDFVNNSGRVWTYDEMSTHLWRYFRGQISSRKIEEALTSHWKSSYCSRNSKKRIFQPKKYA